MKHYLTQTVLFCVATISFYIFIQTLNLAIYRPNAEVITMIVQATVAAQPTPTLVIVTIPVTVEVTRIVALSEQAEPVLSAQAQPTLTPTPVPLLHLTPLNTIDVAVVAPAQDSLTPTPDTAPLAVAPAAVAPPPSTAGKADAVVQAAASACGAPTSGEYTLIPMEAVDVNHPDHLHGDLNLALRGTQPSSAASEFVTYNGPVDAGAPQLTGVFADHRHGPITSVHQVRDWRWDCGEHGCAGDWLTQHEVTLIGLATTPGEAVFFPTRGAEIYGGGYIAVVLYAEESRLTLAYTRDGTVANGYAVHLENFCVDPNLLARYREGNAGGRQQLPGLRNGQTVGVATSSELLIAIRDRGTFMDSRSQSDWWR